MFPRAPLWLSTGPSYYVGTVPTFSMVFFPSISLFHLQFNFRLPMRLFIIISSAIFGDTQALGVKFYTTLVKTWSSFWIIAAAVVFFTRAVKLLTLCIIVCIKFLADRT